MILFGFNYIENGKSKTLVPQERWIFNDDFPTKQAALTPFWHESDSGKGVGGLARWHINLPYVLDYLSRRLCKGLNLNRALQAVEIGVCWD